MDTGSWKGSKPPKTGAIHRLTTGKDRNPEGFETAANPTKKVKPIRVPHKRKSSSCSTRRMFEETFSLPYSLSGIAEQSGKSARASKDERACSGSSPEPQVGLNAPSLPRQAAPQKRIGENLQPCKEGGKGGKERISVTMPSRFLETTWKRCGGNGSPAVGQMRACVRFLPIICTLQVLVGPP